jgi:putative FmdB family regulatory protein
MPIYEYQCTECGKLHEALQKMSDAPLTDCPACGKSALRKNVTAAAFRLKGGGWYETDFKSGNKKNLAGDSDKPAAAAKGSESKPASSETPASKPAKSDTSAGGTAA